MGARRVRTGGGAGARRVRGEGGLGTRGERDMALAGGVGGQFRGDRRHSSESSEPNRRSNSRFVGVWGVLCGCGACACRMLRLRGAALVGPFRVSAAPVLWPGAPAARPPGKLPTRRPRKLDWDVCPDPEGKCPTGRGASVEWDVFQVAVPRMAIRRLARPTSWGPHALEVAFPVSKGDPTPAPPRSRSRTDDAERTVSESALRPRQSPHRARV